MISSSAKCKANCQIIDAARNRLRVILFRDTIYTRGIVKPTTVFDMSVRNIFSPKATRIIRVFLVNPRKEWSILNLSDEADLAYSYTYRLVKAMMKIGLCRKTETNRIVATNPGELLSRWAAIHDFNLLNNVRAYFSTEKSLESLLDKLGSTGNADSRYALTLHAAASLIAPHVRPSSLHIYVEGGEDRLVKRLGVQPTELGGNVYLIQPYDEGVFYATQRAQGVNAVSNVQLYVDLYNYPARGREAAEHLREKAIRF